MIFFNARTGATSRRGLLFVKAMRAPKSRFQLRAHLSAYNSMRALTNAVLNNLAILAACCTLFFAACSPRNLNVEKELVDQVITEFTTERIMHHLHGGGPKSNAETLGRVLKRHALSLNDFSPAFKRFMPEIHSRLLGDTPARR